MSAVLIAVLAGVLVWLLFSATARDKGADPETLEAEREVRDLDAFTTPEDADDELPDWGPGVPKHRQ